MDKIKEALKRTTDTKALLMESGAVRKAGKMFSECFPGHKAIVVADSNTWSVAGRDVLESLDKAGVSREDSFIFTNPDLYAEWSFVVQLRQALKGTDAIAVAVGSGVINDLCKYVSGDLGRRYMCVGTAASMDGFTAYGASITKDGNKQTFSCPAPYAFLLDPEIPARAPEGMSASGYADLMAKVPAGADWMLADALGIEAIDDFAFNLVQDGLKEALSSPAEVRNGSVPETAGLCQGLLMSGFAMQAMQSSRPASGIEHQFSHHWDMEGLSYPDGRHVSHGFKVGIGTLVSTAVWEHLLQRDMSDINVERLVSGWKDWKRTQRDIELLFEGKSGLLRRALEETKAKHTGTEELERRIKAFLTQWPGLRPRIQGQLYSYDKLRSKLETVGAPVTPEQICVSRNELRTAFRRMPYMRSRFTVIDIVFELGLMEEVENALFGKGGRWETI